MIPSPHVSRCGAVALAGLTALSLAACGSSGTSPTASSASSSSAKPATSAAAAPASSSPAAAPKGRDRVFGVVGTVSGTTITLSGSDGPATVDLSPSTRVIQLTAAQLTDVTAGECLVARPTKDTAGTPSVTAAAVLFGPADNGQCAPPGHRQGRGVIGTVASVSGNAITVTTADNTPSTVTVTQQTHFAKRSTADPSVITAGQCLMATGTKANDGTLAATSVNVRPSNNGQCGGKPQGG
jgi:hypothetical protein